MSAVATSQDFLSGGANKTREPTTVLELDWQFSQGGAIQPVARPPYGYASA